MRMRRWGMSFLLAFTALVSACEGLEAGSASAYGGGANGRGLLTPCRPDNPNHVCLAMKFATYVDAAGVPAVTEEEVNETIARINVLWEQCDISFQLEDYAAINAKDLSLSYATRDNSELADIRRKLNNRNSILVVITGPWDRSGTLGKTGANAWTTMPGAGPYGAVLERSVAKNSNLIAHELGHYLNLFHVTDASALMNPVIYGRSTGLYSAQCDTARSAAKYFWSNMAR